MAKTDFPTKTEAQSAGPSAAAPVAREGHNKFQTTLENFCAELSQTDKRVELIGGFHATEKKAGRFKDSPVAYRSRFQVFITRPV